MKTIIDLADDIFLSLKESAARKGISMRAAIHESLGTWLRTQNESSKPSRISRNVGIMKGKGLSKEAAAMAWSEIREMSYSWRGCSLHL